VLKIGLKVLMGLLVRKFSGGTVRTGGKAEKGVNGSLPAAIELSALSIVMLFPTAMSPSALYFAYHS
jgi:hypothetical protein